MNRFHAHSVAFGSTMLLLAAALLTVSLVSKRANAQPAIRETRVGTRFVVYAPPNNDVTNRASAIVITAVAGDDNTPCLVDLVDDSADGDDDDTQLGIALVRGQSYVRYIRDGLNDDFSGRWDGDVFRVNASLPVSVMLVTDSDWQHDWAPADNGSLRGTSFSLFANRTTTSNRDINVFAYEDGTRVALYDVSASALSGSGVTALAAEPVLLLSATLNEGEDLRLASGLGLDLLVAGRSYRLEATRPVTMIYGALGGLDTGSGVRDGGGYVPGRSGVAVDDDFFFAIPHDGGRSGEQELRVVSADDGVVVDVTSFNPVTQAWEPLAQWSLDRLEHADLVGPPSRRFHLTATGGRVAVFEANWLETGAPGTSDVMSFAPGLYGEDRSVEFLTYVGPPGRQTNTIVGSTLSHLYLSSNVDITGVQVVDADTGGTLFSQTLDIAAGTIADVALSLADYQAVNRPAEGLRPYLRVSAPAPLSVCMANWNDNWMAYATAVVIANPEVSLAAPTQVNVGERITLTGGITNQGEQTLTNTEVTVTVPPELRVDEASLSGEAGTITPDSDGTEVSFAPIDLAPGVEAELELTVTAIDGESGALAAVQVVAAGEDGGEVTATSAQSAVVLRDDTVPDLSDLVAVGADGEVRLSWVASGPTATMVVERASASGLAGGAWSTLASSSQQHPGGDAVHAFVDETAANGQALYYRVVATSGEATGQVGPVLGRAQDTNPPPTPSLTVDDTGDTLRVSVTVPETADLRGAELQRAVAGTSQWITLATPGELTSGDTFIDTTAALDVDYRYRARAYDDDGLRSGWSALVGGQLLVPADAEATIVLLYEDMVGEGANDWDYNDLVMEVRTRLNYDAGQLARVRLTLAGLARGAGYLHALRWAVPVTGSWTLTLTRRDAAGLVVDEQTIAGTGALDEQVLESTRSLLVPVDGSYTNTTPAQGAFTEGGVVDIDLQLLTPMPVAGWSLNDAPWDLYLRMPYLDAPHHEVHRAAYAPQLPGRFELCVEGPVAGRALPFVLEVSDIGGWPFEGQAIWIPFADYTAFIEGGEGLWLPEPVAPSSVFHPGR